VNRCNIANNPLISERDPSVALKRSGGSFVVAYDSSLFLVNRVKVAEVSAWV